MFRDRVKEHYRVRGYTLHEGAKVRGRSGTIYRCDLVAEGPMGSLVVSFGDAGGFEGPELQAVKRQAQDIGAGAVVASPQLDSAVHQAAREQGIILLDDPTLDQEDGPRAKEDDPFRAHPWPDPERRRRTGGGAAEGLWTHPRQQAQQVQEVAPVPDDGPDLGIPVIGADDPGPAPAETSTAQRRPSFDWLPGQGAPRPRPIHPDPAEPAWKVRERTAQQAQRPSPWRWVLAPLLFGTATALVLFLLFILL